MRKSLFNKLLASINELDGLDISAPKHMPFRRRMPIRPCRSIRRFRLSICKEMRVRRLQRRKPL